MSEKKVPWSDFSEQEKAMLAKAMCQHAGYRRYDRFLRILNLGSPTIIIGNGPDGAYCRIDKASEDIVALLIKNYG